MDTIDVLIIGGGLAGWRAAEAAASRGASVALVANGVGNSPGIHALNVPVGPGDSVELFIEDTLQSGRDACERDLVETMCREAVALADEFPFDRNPDGSFHMLQPLGCSVPRCVSINHRIGAWILGMLRKKLADRVQIIRGRATAIHAEASVCDSGAPEARGTAVSVGHSSHPCYLCEISCASEAGSAAASVEHPCEMSGAEPIVVRARSVVLATGGWCGKYDFSDNPPELRGDGIALAQSLGAAVRDMDAVQYEPTVALAPAQVRGIPVITTMMFEGATFRNRDGAEFLPDKHANKDAISRAIFAEIEAGRGISAPSAGGSEAEPPAIWGVWFDATGVDPRVLATRYADTVRRYADAGVDITREPMLVAPAPHTSLGGVAIDARCRVLRPDGTPVPGLFAAGEVTGGVHGLNRIGGNAGTEVLVFGRIAGQEAADHANRQ